MAGEGYRLGIDFGTSNTVAVYTVAGGPSRQLLFDASPLLPSAVFANADGGLRTGVDAERAALGYPAGFEPHPKRRVDDGTVWLGEQEVSVVDLIAAVLSRVAAEAERVVGRAPGSVVLTHPAGWTGRRLGVLTEAAQRAGLAVVGFVPEPVAAAAYFLKVLGGDVPHGRCLVMYDLGAGTFDASVVRVDGGALTVVSTGGLDDVGGLDLDAAIVELARAGTAHTAAAWARLDWPHSEADRYARHGLWRDARAAKELMSRHATAALRLPVLDAVAYLTREEFERAARPLLERTVESTLDTLRAGRVEPAAVAGAFLVGGSSRDQRPRDLPQIIRRPRTNHLLHHNADHAAARASSI